jgi:hypothetical protein
MNETNSHNQKFYYQNCVQKKKIIHAHHEFFLQKMECGVVTIQAFNYTDNRDF